MPIAPSIIKPSINRLDSTTRAVQQIVFKTFMAVQVLVLIMVFLSDFSSVSSTCTR